MILSRRTFILAAGGTGLALIGAGGVFAVTRVPNKALKPWNDIAYGAAPSDIRLDAFRHAILAPNPHNRQPWLIRLVGENDAVITCDLNRRLAQTDPFDRQILIGFGCLLELARMAAAERGWRMDISAFPDGDPGDRLDDRPIAYLRFTPDPSVKRDPLAAFIIHRRSNKQPFNVARPVEQDLIDRLISQQSPEALIGGTNGVAMVTTLRRQTQDAWDVEFETERTWMESVNLMRIGKSEIEARPDGISIGGPLLEVLALTGQISRDQIGRAGTTAHSSSRQRYVPIMATGMAYVWVVTKGNSRSQQLAAGQAYVRMNLEATRHGLGMQPVSQALQEFPEMAKSFAAIHETVGAKSGERVQMIARLGYGPKVPATPRWPLANQLIGNYV